MGLVCTDGSEIAPTNKSASNVGEDCDTGDGTVAISPVPFYNLHTALGLTAQESLCLNDKCDTKNDINSYLKQNINADGQYDADALSFASAVAKTLVENSCNDDFEVDWDDPIINKLTGKALCVYEKMQDLSSTLFTDILSKQFFGSKEAIVVFEVGEIPDENDFVYSARTYPSYAGDNSKRFFRIRLKSSFVQNASSIEIALALIHETIHAELLERCIQSGLILNIASNGGYTFQNYGNFTVLNNNTLFNAITTFYKNLGNGNPQWNHDQFNIFDYRKELSKNLSSLHPWLDNHNSSFESTINTDNSIEDLKMVFDNLAWIGLEETIEYKALSDFEKTRKLYISQLVNSTYEKECN